MTLLPLRLQDVRVGAEKRRQAFPDGFRRRTSRRTPGPPLVPGPGRGFLFDFSQLPSGGYFFFTSLSTSAFMLAFSATMKDSKFFPLM